MADDKLARVVGVPGAVLLGLGSIVGSGIFVSLGMAAEVAGSAVVLAVVLASAVATCNGLSSAQLAASHPVSGGTYEYGYRYLHPALGFTAGWMFLCAKSASAATAALGFAAYLLEALGGASARVPVALGAVALFTIVTAAGIRQSNRTNAIVVSITLAALVALVIAGSTRVTVSHLFDADAGGLLHATALMFVAFTGYGRIATLGEEVRDPQKSIPRAIVITLVASMVLYVSVALVAVSTIGADALGHEAAPLEAVAVRFGIRGLVAAGAITAMLGVLLNLILGLSRVLLAMARRGDMPRALAHVEGSSPRRAILVIGALIAMLTAIGDVKTTWTFSAFTVLVYYALTNLAGLRLPPDARRYPRWVAALGLCACLGLAFWVPMRTWLVGLGLLALGLVWHFSRASARRDRSLLPPTPRDERSDTTEREIDR